MYLKQQHSKIRISQTKIAVQRNAESNFKGLRHCCRTSGKHCPRTMGTQQFLEGGLKNPNAKRLARKN